MGTLKPEEIEMVLNVWKPRVEDPEAFGLLILDRFFAKHDYYGFFVKFKDHPRDKLHENEAYRAHGKRIVSYLDNAMRNLDNLEVLVDILHRLGKSHAKKLVKQEQFNELLAVLMDIFKDDFGCSDEELAAIKKVLNTAWRLIFQGLESI